MLLESDSEDEVEEVEVEQLKEFPVLKQQQIKETKAQPLNYSRLINMTEEETKQVAIKKAEIKIPVPKPLVQRGKLDWATAESDSEGDEEEEDYYPAKKQVKEDLSAW
jgi:hypothetical protein